MGGLVEVKMMLLWFTIISFMTFMVVVIMTIMVVVVTFFIIMAMVCMWVGLDRHHLDRQRVRKSNQRGSTHLGSPRRLVDLHLMVVEAMLMLLTSGKDDHAEQADVCEPQLHA